MSDVTRILSAIEQGDPQASEQLLPLVYDELRKLAAQKMAQEAKLYAQVYDCTIKRTTKKGRLVIENVAPEEFLTERRAVAPEKLPRTITTKGFVPNAG